MQSNILEIHSAFHQEEEDYSMFVAIRTSESNWKAYVKRCARLDLASCLLTVKSGKRLKAATAAEIFPNLAKTLQYDN